MKIMSPEHDHKSPTVLVIVPRGYQVIVATAQDPLYGLRADRIFIHGDILKDKNTPADWLNMVKCRSTSNPVIS